MGRPGCQGSPAGPRRLADNLSVVGGRLRQEVKLKTGRLEGWRGQHADGIKTEAAGGAQRHLTVAATISAVVHLDGEAGFLERHNSAHTPPFPRKITDVFFSTIYGQALNITSRCSFVMLVSVRIHQRHLRVNSPGQPPMSCSGPSGWSQRQSSPPRPRKAAQTLCKISLKGWGQRGGLATSQPDVSSWTLWILCLFTR